MLKSNEKLLIDFCNIYFMATRPFLSRSDYILERPCLLKPMWLAHAAAVQIETNKGRLVCVGGLLCSIHIADTGLVEYGHNPYGVVWL